MEKHFINTFFIINVTANNQQNLTVNHSIRVVFLYPKVMKQLNIPFILGRQYDNWEFDLEVTNDRIQGL